MSTKKSDKELAEAHRYVVEPGGKPVIGVTSVNIIEKPAFKWTFATVAAAAAWDNRAGWRELANHYRLSLEEGSYYKRNKLTEILAKAAAEGRDPEEAFYLHWCRGECNRQWGAKADLGNRVHGHALAGSQHKWIDVLLDEEPYIDALYDFYENHLARFLMCEVIVGHPAPEGDPLLAYGGRLDAIGELRYLDGACLWDYKTGGEYTDSTAIQLVAYGRTKGVIEYDAAGMVSGWAPLPVIRHYRTVYLEPTGKCRVVNPYEELTEDESWQAFLHLRAVVNFASRVDDIKKAKEKATKEASR